MDNKDKRVLSVAFREVQCAHLYGHQEAQTVEEVIDILDYGKAGEEFERFGSEHSETNPDDPYAVFDKAKGEYLPHRGGAASCPSFVVIKAHKGQVDKVWVKGSRKEAVRLVRKVCEEEGFDPDSSQDYPGEAFSFERDNHFLPTSYDEFIIEEAAHED